MRKNLYRPFVLASILLVILGACKSETGSPNILFIAVDDLRTYNCESLEALASGILTLDQHFENHGYEIWAAGKIYHSPGKCKPPF
jgi:hypothetical protein